MTRKGAGFHFTLSKRFCKKSHTNNFVSVRNSLGNVRLQYKMFTKNRISVVSGWKLVTQLNTSAVLNPDLNSLRGHPRDAEMWSSCMILQ